MELPGAYHTGRGTPFAHGPGIDFTGTPGYGLTRMRRSSVSSNRVSSLLPAILLFAVLPALAQNGRTPDGHPDLQGYWSDTTLTPLERPRDLAGKAVFTEQEAAEWQKKTLAAVSYERRDGGPDADINRSYNELFRERGEVVPDRRTSLIVDPPDGRIPALTAEGQKKAKARAEDRKKRGADPADSWEDRNLAERCLTRGAPKIPGGYNNNFQIVQTPEYVMILQEMIHEARIIPIETPAEIRAGSPIETPIQASDAKAGSRPHPSPSVHLWLGDSIGHWEGDTLVVETTNFDDRIVMNSFNCCGLAGEHLRITERFRRVSATMIEHTYTVDDPVIYTRPWTVSVPLQAIDSPVYEYACHEGNLAMIGILNGARVKEANAAREVKEAAEKKEKQETPERK